MNVSTVDTQPAATLPFRTFAVRTAMLEGLPWFYLDDLCAALRRTPEAGKIVNDARFPQFARRSHRDPEAGEVTVISPIGTFYLTELIDRLGGQALAAWTRRQQQRLCPEPVPGDPNAFLTMLPDNCLPPRPGKYSGRLAEWDELRFSPAASKKIGRWPAYYAPVIEAFRGTNACALSNGGLTWPAVGSPSIEGGAR